MKNATDIEVGSSKIQVTSDGRTYIFGPNCLWAEIDSGSLVIQSGDNHSEIIATFACGKWDFVERVYEENNL